MYRPLYALFAAAVFALSMLVVAPSATQSVAPASPAAPLRVASDVEPMLGCGETHCTRDADCPSNCGGCITWSGTCALFQPR